LSRGDEPFRAHAKDQRPPISKLDIEEHIQLENEIIRKEYTLKKFSAASRNVSAPDTAKLQSVEHLR
jgi:hypothetical protein